MLDDLGIGPCEIEAHAAILGFHMRDENAPPGRKSTVELVVCQSSEAVFHCLMSSGEFQACQTCSIGASTLVSMVILFATRFPLPFFILSCENNILSESTKAPCCTRSGLDGAQPGHGSLFRNSTCPDIFLAPGESKFHEYPTGSHRSQVIHRPAPRRLTVYLREHGRYFDRELKHQQHQREERSGQDVLNSRHDGKACKQERDAGEHNPKIWKRHPVGNEASISGQIDQVPQAEADWRQSQHPTTGNSRSLSPHRIG